MVVMFSVDVLPTGFMESQSGHCKQRGMSTIFCAVNPRLNASNLQENPQLLAISQCPMQQKSLHAVPTMRKLSPHNLEWNVIN